jgi:hypothetical protein
LLVARYWLLAGDAPVMPLASTRMQPGRLSSARLLDLAFAGKFASCHRL